MNIYQIRILTYNVVVLMALSSGSKASAIQHLHVEVRGNALSLRFKNLINVWKYGKVENGKSLLSVLSFANTQRTENFLW